MVAVCFTSDMKGCTLLLFCIWTWSGSGPQRWVYRTGAFGKVLWDGQWEGVPFSMSAGEFGSWGTGPLVPLCWTGCGRKEEASPSPDLPPFNIPGICLFLVQPLGLEGLPHLFVLSFSPLSPFQIQISLWVSCLMHLYLSFLLCNVRIVGFPLAPNSWHCPPSEGTRIARCGAWHTALNKTYS